MEVISSSEHWIKLSEVKVLKGRARKKFENLLPLAKSILKHGLINPITINRDNLSLIAGERRHRACTMLPMLWDEEENGKLEGNTSPSGRIANGFVPVCYRDELSSVQLKEIELEENLERESLDPFEECELKAQIDEHKRLLYGDASSANPGGWSIAKTAERFGEDKSTTGKKIEFAKKMRTATEEEKARIYNLPLTAAMKEYSRIEQVKEVERKHAAGTLKFEENFQHGDALVLIKEVPSSSVDLLLTDPPFGIPDISDAQEGERGGTTTYSTRLKLSDNLDSKSASELLTALAPELYRVLKPSAHFWTFFAWEIYEPLKSAMLKAGFEVCPVPIIWNKGRSTAPFRGYEPAPSYEPILFGHKPPREKRLSDNCQMVFTVSPVSSNKKVHPFEKPEELLSKIIKLSTNKGDTILDPFGGSASTLLAARNLDRGCVSFEKDKENFTKAQGRLIRGSK